MSTDTSPVLLSPRPYERHGGRLLLLPLLPEQKRYKPLPSELWTEILAFAMLSDTNGETVVDSWAWALLRICKTIRDVALPLVYSTIHLSQLDSLEALYKRLQSADQKWDSIRRIPYSTPGRWVQTLDLSEMSFQGQLDSVRLDALLTRLFPLTPFLASLSVNPSFILSRGALASLANRDGATHIRSLTGLSYLAPPSADIEQDPFVKLLKSCPKLERFGVVGQGLDPAELEFDFSGHPLPSLVTFAPFELPKLRWLSLLSMHSSPLMVALLNSPLPALKELTITPYDDIPYPAAMSTLFTSSAHGKSISSLSLLTPKSWPTRLHPSPRDIFSTCPSLIHLSLENPLPNLTLTEDHHLKTLSIPRPKGDFWPVLERLLSHLPDLAVVRARDVRWVRQGISARAQEAGVQGEMKEWQRRLARRHIRVVDADWRSDSGEHVSPASL